ncbi:MAG: hypothetical protein ACKOPT_17120, partial [Cyanobium sp.]
GHYLGAYRRMLLGLRQHPHPDSIAALLKAVGLPTFPAHQCRGLDPATPPGGNNRASAQEGQNLATRAGAGNGCRHRGQGLLTNHSRGTG